MTMSKANQTIHKHLRDAIAPTSIVAIVHDGTMDGDCPLGDFTEIKVSGTCVPENILADSVKLAFLKNLWKEEMIKLNGEDEYIDDEVKEIKGAWLFDEEVYVRVCNGMSYAPVPGNDSSCYAMQSLMKGMFHEFAFVRIGKDPTKR